MGSRVLPPLLRMLKSPLRATSPRVPSPEHIRPPRAGGCRLLRPPCWDPHSGKGRRAAEVGSSAGGAPSRPVPGRPSRRRNCRPPRSSCRPRCSPECDSQRPPGPSQEAHSWDGGAGGAVSRPRTALQGASVARGLHRAGHVPVCLKWRLGWLRSPRTSLCGRRICGSA